MTRKILMNVADGDECRIAVLEDDKLCEYFVDRPSQLKHVGNIYKGLIENVEAGIQAAFVDIGLERNGFLHVSDVLFAYENNPALTDLFPRSLRIREPLPEDAMVASGGERDVEEVQDYVGGHEVPHESPHQEGSPSREDEFLDHVNEPAPGHRLTESPLNVEPPRTEPVPAAPHADSVEGAEHTPALPDDAGEGDEGVAPRPQAAPQPQPQTVVAQPAPGAHTDEDDDDDDDDDDDGDDTEAPGMPPGVPGAPGAEQGEGRKRRRRGRRGGRRRREAREAAERAAQQGAAPAATAPAENAPLAAPVQQAHAETAPPAAPVQQAAPVAEPAPAADTAPAGEQPHSAEAQREKRRRMPKLRGGRMPKRVLEDIQPTGPAPENSPAPENPPAQGSGGDGAPPPNGPALRFHRGPLPKIQNLLHRNQEVVVQVTKASQGGKGPGLSTFISLPGRYMVLTPNSQRGGVSRKIEDGHAREELRRILDRLPVPEGMGVIIRTAAIDRSMDELQRDLNYLLRIWNVITQRLHEAPAPALLYSDSDPAIRAVRDYFTAETAEIVIDDRAVYERVLAFFDTLMPTFRDRVKLYESDVPLFYAAGVEGQIDHIFDKKVTLKSGGYLYVEQTEALVSIDVNSGRFTSAGDAERTAYLTNMEAIPEICRQLRLRDLGGIVCCDLIDMMNAKHRSDVENALKRELRRDRARTKVARMSPFGVIEMTRQRVRPSIKAYTYVACPTCSGFGMVHSAETMCLSLIRRMKLALCEERVRELAVQVHPHVLSHLHSEFRTDIDDLEEEFGKRIAFEYARDLTLGQTRFYYVNDRAVRVLYDIDQRINSFARDEHHKSKASAAAPVAASGSAGGTFGGGEPRGNRKRKRGGRRQREQEQERQQRQQRIQAESQKAVSFGATLPELPPLEVIREPQPHHAAPSGEAAPQAQPAEGATAPQGQAQARQGGQGQQRQGDGRQGEGRHGRRRRGRRRGGRDRERQHGQPQQQGQPQQGQGQPQQRPQPQPETRHEPRPEPQPVHAAEPARAPEPPRAEQPAPQAAPAPRGGRRRPERKPAEARSAKPESKPREAKPKAAKAAGARKPAAKAGAATAKKPAAKKPAAKKPAAKATKAKGRPAKG